MYNFLLLFQYISQALIYFIMAGGASIINIDGKGKEMEIFELMFIAQKLKASIPRPKNSSPKLV